MAIINGTSVEGMTLQADYSYAQNTSANTSTVTVILKIVGHYALYASAIPRHKLCMIRSCFALKTIPPKFGI